MHVCWFCRADAFSRFVGVLQHAHRLFQRTLLGYRFMCRLLQHTGDSKHLNHLHELRHQALLQPLTTSEPDHTANCNNQLPTAATGRRQRPSIIYGIVLTFNHLVCADKVTLLDFHLPHRQQRRAKCWNVPDAGRHQGHWWRCAAV